MELTITVRACDVCGRGDRPTTRYTLTSENAEPVTRDLCAEDAAPLEAAFGPLATPEGKGPADVFLTHLHAAVAEAGRQTTGEPDQPQTAPVVKAARKTAAKKTTAKKAASKTTATKRTASPRGRTRVVTLEQIEEEKKARQASGESES